MPVSPAGFRSKKKFEHAGEAEGSLERRPGWRGGSRERRYCPGARSTDILRVHEPIFGDVTYIEQLRESGIEVGVGRRVSDDER